MKTQAFSTIVSKDSMPIIYQVLDYVQQNTSGANFCVAKIEDDKDDVLFYVLGTNLVDGQEGAFVRRFLNAVERPGYKSTLPLMTYTEYPEIKTPELLQEKISKYRDGSCKVNFYRRTCKA